MARATSGKAGLVLVAALVAAVWGSAGCSAPPSGPTAPATKAACLGQPPASWQAALQRSTIVLPDGVSLGISAVDGELGFGQYELGQARGIGYLSLVSGRLTRISTYTAGVSGLGWLAVQRPWVVWEQLDSVSDLTDWSVQAYNLSTGTGFVLARSDRVPGQQPMPVLHNGVAVWAHPARGGSQIRAVDLATRREQVVASGYVGAPTYAGGYIVWATADGALRAVDAASLRPVQLPDGLRRPGPVRDLAGSADYLLWSGQDLNSLTAWRFDTGLVRTYTLPDRRHFFQFLQVAGDFVVWFSGLTSSVLDLTTGAGFDLAGTAAGSPEWIAASGPQMGSGANRPAVYAVRRIATRSAGHISRCQ